MPVFRYRAVTAGGEFLQGELEAASRDAAIARLQASQSYPIQVESSRAAGAANREGGAQAGRGIGGGVASKDLATFTRELATLIGSGMPLDRSLAILGEITPAKRLRSQINDTLDKIRSGLPFAAALQAQGRTFSQLYVSMVRAGEAGGSLDVVLERLAEYLEKARELRETIISALIYPAILVCVALLSLVLLLTQVVPQFTEMFRDAGTALPLATRVVITIGEWTREWWWLILLGLVIAAIGFRALLEIPSVRYGWHRLILAVPMFGDLVRKVEVARLSRTLGTLLANGVAMLNALRIAQETITNRVIADGMARLSEGIKQGQGLAEPLAKANLFPELAVHMIRVGEETGQLESMLGKVADAYESEVSLAVKRVLALLEPVLILGLGLVIAGIIVSVLLAVLSVNELAF